MNNLLYWLKRPYYLNPSTRYRLFISLGMGLFIFLFLYNFRPFKMDTVDNNIFYYTLGFGSITTVSLLIVLFIFPLIIPSFFNENKWTVVKQAVLIIAIILIISSANWFYNSLVQKGGDEGILTFSSLLYKTFSIGFFPVFIVLFFDEFFSRKKREKIASIINTKELKHPVKLKKVNTIKIGNKNSFLELNIDCLLYISSQANYASFFVLEDKNIKELVLRSTLQSIENQLNTCANIYRCHKSYIINASFFNKISGNARGYQLKSSFLDFLIPVSRDFPKERLQNLINTSSLSS